MAEVASVDVAGTFAPVARQRLRWTRTTGQRVILGVNILLVVALGAGALAVGYLTQKLADVEVLAVADDLTAAPTERVVSAAALEVVEDTEPVVTVPGQSTTTTEFVLPAPEIEENYLVVGSDNAERVADDNAILSGREEERANHLADTIMVLRLRPAEGTASLLSVPRDLEVRIAGTNRIRKINTAFNLPDREARVSRLINTIEENLDITLQHYVEVDLEGFRRVIDALGGVAVCFDGPSQDSGSGLVVNQGGWSELDGDQALAYVRSRKLKVQNLSGRWENVSLRADLDRIERQQDFVRATVSQTFADVVSDPRLLVSILNIASEELSVSNTFTVVGDGSDLASWFRGFGEENLETMSLDVYDLPVTEARNNEFRLGMTSRAEPQLDIFRGIELDDVVPKRVEVLLRGPSAVRGPVRDGLVGIGFKIGRQDSKSDATDATVIAYGVGGHEAATLVAAFLDGGVEFSRVEDVEGNEVVVDLGPDAIVRETPRVLETRAPPVEVPPTSAPTTVPADSTTTAPHRFEFDCSLSTGG